MNRKGQLAALIPIGVVIFLIIILSPMLASIINSASCQNEKNKINDLQGKLSECNTLLNLEKQKSQNALSGLNDCQNKLIECQGNLETCNKNNDILQNECAKKEQPKTEYYFIKIYNDRILLFQTVVIYNVYLFGLFTALGITFTVKFFEVDVEIKVLNKKNQKKLIKVIREYLIQYPYIPVIIVIVAIILSNLVLLFVK